MKKVKEKTVIGKIWMNIEHHSDYVKTFFCIFGLILFFLYSRYIKYPEHRKILNEIVEDKCGNNQECLIRAEKNFENCLDESYEYRIGSTRFTPYNFKVCMSNETGYRFVDK